MLTDNEKKEYGHADDFMNGRQQRLSTGTVAVLLNTIDRLVARIKSFERSRDEADSEAAKTRA